jgi:hypothetical protein
MKISFLPSDEYVSRYVPHPKPAKNCIPDWYKKIPAVKENEQKMSNGKMKIDLSALKACMPFIDALGAGYIQETWTDIEIGKVNEQLEYNFPLGPDIMKLRKNVNVSLSFAYFEAEFVWQSVWRPKLPEGYSILITHPLNRLDLPFTTMTGIIDADEFYHTRTGSIPFFIHNSFTGVIPVGTPMFQMIPIKRDVWESVVEPFDPIVAEKQNREIRQHVWKAYKNKFWHKKSYS